MTPYESLKRRIENRSAVVGVVGLGYVGLPLLHAMHQGGMRVIGFDIDQGKVDMLTAGRNYLKHLGDAMVGELAKSSRFAATTDLARLGEADVLLVCVPTPLGRHQEPDLSYVLHNAAVIGKALRSGQLIVLESTTYPGTTRQDFLSGILAAAAAAGVRLECGKDFFVAHSPEREDPGRRSHSVRNIPKLVGGLDAPSTDLATMLYGLAVQQVVRVSSAEVAEASKLLENIFRSVNIALVNEMKMILTDMGIDVWEVVRAASTKPFGYMPFFPGPGLGGHCIPIDPFYLAWKAKEFGRQTRFIELAGAVNTSMPAYVVERTSLALNERGKAVKGARVLVLGLAYKADIDDTRESPSFELIEKLHHLGAKVDYSDPFIARTTPVRKHDLQMESVTLTPHAIAGYDALLVATAHSAFDYAAIAKHARLVIDTRDALREHAAAMGDRLVKA
ncbi:MAG: nucleotide sugar dehydrogenase [Planctomycetota bacterium]